MSSEAPRILHSASFEHIYQNMTTPLQVDIQIASVGNDVVDITIKNDQGKLLGYINGWLRSEFYENAFYAIASSNLQRSKSGVYVPRTVGGTIAELTIGGVVDIWHSSPLMLLSDAAKDMYGKYLASRKELLVGDPSLTAGQCYTVRRAL